MKLFGRTVPLWATLIPLALAVGLYWRWWDARLVTFRADVGAALGPTITVQYGGFPYRLHAEGREIALARTAADMTASLQVTRFSVDRQPAAESLSVIGLASPRVAVEANGLAGARFAITAPSGRASVRRDGGRLVRLSAEFRDAALVLGLIPAKLTFASFELHVRETPVAPILLPTGPRMPVQAEIRAGGGGLRIDSGDPLTLTADLALTAASPIRSARGWTAQSGTAEVRRLTLADRLGIVADLSATVVPRGGGLEMAGTVRTVCPRTVLAALAHRPLGKPEYRARTVLVIPFGGSAGAVSARVNEPALGAWTVRAQEPPCPAIRR